MRSLISRPLPANVKRMTSVRSGLRLRAVALGVALVWLAAVAIAPRPAHALSRDVKAVLIISGYGMAGGTILGAAALPFNQDLRTVFIGTSIGLYLGIAVGFYYIYDRYAQENPIETRPRGRVRQSSAVDQELRALALTRTTSGFEASPAARAPLRVDVPVLRF